MILTSLHVIYRINESDIKGVSLDEYVSPNPLCKVSAVTVYRQKNGDIVNKIHAQASVPNTIYPDQYTHLKKNI